MSSTDRTSRAAGLAVTAGPVLIVGAIVVWAAAGPSSLVPASRHGLPPWMAGPLADGPSLGRARLMVALPALLGLYAVAVARAPRLGVRPVVAAIVAAHVLLLLGPPLLSADVFGYIGYGRLGAVHDVSPYAHGAAALGNDPVHRFILWRDAIDPYGPVFTLLTFGVAGLGVPAALWFFKALAVAAGLACVALVVRTAPRLGLDPARAAALVGLNPVLLVYAVGGAHNDMIVAALTAWAISLVVRRSSVRGAAALLAGATKASALVVVPFVLAGRPRRRALVPSALTAGALVAVTLVAFGGRVTGMAGAVVQQQSHVATHSVPGEVVATLGLAGLPTTFRVLDAAVLVLAVAACLRRAWQGGDVVASAGWATMALLVTTAWLLPWYVVWLLPLAALGGDRRLERATLALTAYLVITRIIPTG